MAPSIAKALTGLLISYLLGSIPVAYCLGKFSKGIDLRKHGSGNLGATNAFRVLGKKIGAAVLLLDISKGLIAVLLADYYFYPEGLGIDKNVFACLASIAVVSGHNWTIFLGFKGGKGIATSLGVLIAFSILVEGFFWLLIVGVFLWLVTFLMSGFVSLASVICSIILPFLAIFFSLPKEIVVFLLILSVLSIIRHKPNIIRLLQKKESRFDTRSLLKKISFFR